MAGLIAGHPRPDGGGPVGIAPAAQIFDVQVYDEAEASTAPDSTESPITVENLRAGLDAVIAAVPALGIRIVNMSLAIPDDAEIRAKIAQLWDLGVGRRRAHRQPLRPSCPTTCREHLRGAPARRGRRAVIHPADYDDVLGVNASPAGSSDAGPDRPGSWRTR